MGRAGQAHEGPERPEASRGRPEPSPRGRRLRGRVTLTRDGNIHVEIEQPKGEAQPLIPSVQRHRCQMPTCLRWCYVGGLGGSRTLGLAADVYCGNCIETLVLRCLE